MWNDTHVPRTLCRFVKTTSFFLLYHRLDRDGSIWLGALESKIIHGKAGDGLKELALLWSSGYGVIWVLRKHGKRDGGGGPQSCLYQESIAYCSF